MTSIGTIPISVAALRDAGVNLLFLSETGLG